MSYVSTTKRRGFFIVLEGIDGSGKTTIASMLVRKLSELGYNVAYTYEPTDSEITMLIRTKYDELRDPYIDTLAFALDRLLHVKAEIRPLLEKGFVVVLDRYFYSSIAYQVACGAPMEWVVEVNRWAPKPDLAIYLDVEPEVALQRKARGSSRFPEFEELVFLRKVREIYLYMVSQGALVKVDASRDIVEVYKDIEKIVFKMLNSTLSPNS